MPCSPQRLPWRPISSRTASWYACAPRHLATSLVLLLATLSGAFAADTATSWRGRPVTELIAAFERSGAQVVYSNELLTPAMRIGAEPQGPTLAARVQDALAPLGLQLVEVAPGHFAIARRAPAAVASAARQDAAPPVAPLQEVAIYASRYTLDSRGLGLPTTLTRASLEQSPGTRNDVLRASQSLPGVANATSSQPYIRGSLPEDVLISFDHVTIQDPFHLQGFQRLIGVFDSSVIQQVDVYTGGYPVRYGTRSGGVIEITPRELPLGKSSGLDVGTQTIGASTVGRAEDLPLNWLVSVRGNSLDLRHRAVGSGSRQSRLFDFVGRVKWQPTDDVSWTLGALALDDHIDLQFRFGAQSAAGDSRDAHAWLVREQALRGDWRSVVVLDGAREVFEYTAGQGFGSDYGSLLQGRRFDTWKIDARWFQSTPGKSGWDVGAGTFLTTGDNQLRSNIPMQQQWRTPATSVVPSFINEAPRQAGGSAYVSRRMQWREDLDGEFGLRYDTQRDDADSSRAQWSPRVNLHWQASRRLGFQASLGRFSQAQRPDEWRLESGQNRADPAQTVDAAVIGMIWAADSGWRWRLESYHKHWLRVTPYFDNLFNPQALTAALAPDRVRIAPDSARASGLELSTTRDLSEHLRLWGNASWASVVDDFGSQQVPRRWDQRWTGNAGINWSGPRLNVAAMVRIHQGWPRTPLLEVSGAAPGGVLYVAGPRNSARWGAFASADVHVAWLVPLARSSLEFWADATNLANRGNPCCMAIRMLPGGFAAPGTVTSWQRREFDAGVSWRLPH